MKPGQRVHVTGPVWLLVGQRLGSFPHCHGVLIKGRGQTALVDTGCGGEILTELAASDEVDLVLNTHTHPDHSAGNHHFDGTEILVPVQARQSAGQKKLLSQRFTEPGELAKEWHLYVSEQMDFQDQLPTGFFESNQEITVGGEKLVTIPAPGHTVDHHLLYLPEHGVLLSADIDFTSFGPFYGHHESNMAQFANSIEQIKEIKPKVVVSAHRQPPYEDIDQAVDDFLAIMDRREQRILELVERGLDRHGLVEASPFYGGHRFYPKLSRFWEGQMIDNHLDSLVKRGLILPGPRPLPNKSG